MIPDLMDEATGWIVCAVLVTLIPLMMLWILFDDYVLDPIRMRIGKRGA